MDRESEKGGSDPAPGAAATLAGAAGIVLTFNLVSRVLGFVRDAVIAAEFGATRATDAYLIAYTLPYSLQAVLGMALATVMVPLLSGYLVRDQLAEARRLTAAVLAQAGLGLVLLVLAGIALAPQLVRLLAPGFEPGLLALTVDLTRIIFPSVFFMGIGMVFTGVLNASGRFAIPALAPAVSNIVVILAVPVLSGRLLVKGVAWATLAGFLGFFLVQLVDLRASSLAVRLRATGRLLGERLGGQVWRELGPVVLSVAVVQIYLAVNRAFASGLEAGSISALDFANRVINLPLGIFVAAVTTAVFPLLARTAALGDRRALAGQLERGLGLVLLAMLPATVGLVVLRTPLVSLLFQRGAFDLRATGLTAEALLYFALGLPALAANNVLTRGYYALRDVRTPLILGLFSIGLDVALSLLLVHPLGHGGLALANSLAATGNAVGLYALLRRPLPDLRPGPLAGSLSRMALASLLMGCAVLWLARFLLPAAGGGGFPWPEALWLGAAAGGTPGQLLWRLPIAVLAGAVVYCLLVIALRTGEAGQALALLRRRPRR